jgi:hypothetical protein
VVVMAAVGVSVPAGLVLQSGLMPQVCGRRRERRMIWAV